MAKRLMKRRTKVNIPICAAAVLLCLTMFSLHLTSGIYARYTATASGHDSARVIKFGELTITETTSKASQYIVPGGELVWGGTVNFTGSESATYVFLEIDLTGNWVVTNGNQTFSLYADVPSWTVHGDWTHLDGTDDPYVYYMELDPNDTLTAQPIFVSDSATLPQTISDDILTALNTLSGSFRASVVQSNGFTSADPVAEAWASLSANH